MYMQPPVIEETFHFLRILIEYLFLLNMSCSSLYVLSLCLDWPDVGMHIRLRIDWKDNLCRPISVGDSKQNECITLLFHYNIEDL